MERILEDTHEELPPYLQYHIMRSGISDFYLTTNPDRQHANEPIGPSYYIHILTSQKPTADAWLNSSRNSENRKPSQNMEEDDDEDGSLSIVILVHDFDNEPDSVSANSKDSSELNTDLISKGQLVPVIHMRRHDGDHKIKVDILEGSKVEWNFDLELHTDPYSGKSKFSFTDPWGKKWGLVGKTLICCQSSETGEVISRFEKKSDGSKIGSFMLEQAALKMLDLMIAVHMGAYCFWQVERQPGKLINVATGIFEHNRKVVNPSGDVVKIKKNNKKKTGKRFFSFGFKKKSITGGNSTSQTVSASDETNDQKMNSSVNEGIGPNVIKTPENEIDEIAMGTDAIAITPGTPKIFVSEADSRQDATTSVSDQPSKSSLYTLRLVERHGDKTKEFSKSMAQQQSSTIDATSEYQNGGNLLVIDGSTGSQSPRFSTSEDNIYDTSLRRSSSKRSTRSGRRVSLTLNLKPAEPSPEASGSPYDSMFSRSALSRTPSSASSGSSTENNRQSYISAADFYHSCDENRPPLRSPNSLNSGRRSSQNMNFFQSMPAIEAHPSEQAQSIWQPPEPAQSIRQRPSESKPNTGQLSRQSQSIWQVQSPKIMSLQDIQSEVTKISRDSKRVSKRLSMLGFFSKT
ncbi:hypothetical protein V1511DRAFT_107363 [Dipodascopsis uninucleata]